MLRLAAIMALALTGCSPAEPPLMIDPSDAPETSAEAPASADGRDMAREGASNT